MRIIIIIIIAMHSVRVTIEGRVRTLKKIKTNAAELHQAIPRLRIPPPQVCTDKPIKLWNAYFPSPCP
jgi:hypothetical protein